MDKTESKPIPHFKKGDAFVEMAPHPLVFMEVNEVEMPQGQVTDMLMLMVGHKGV